MNNNDTPADYYRRKQEEADKAAAALREHRIFCKWQIRHRWRCKNCVELERQLKAARYVGD